MVKYTSERQRLSTGCSNMEVIGNLMERFFGLVKWRKPDWRGVMSGRRAMKTVFINTDTFQKFGCEMVEEVVPGSRV